MKLLFSQLARSRAVRTVAAVPAKRRASVVLSATMLALAGLAFVGSAQAQSCAIGETPVAFGFTGSDQTTVVPAGVHSVTVYLSGAQGGNGLSGAGSIGGSPNSPGGTAVSADECAARWRLRPVQR